LTKLFSFEQFLGAIGGKPRHGLYFVGSVSDEGDYHLYFLDPHVVQDYKPLGEECSSEDHQKWKTFHCRKMALMPMKQMDPSCALGFAVNSQAEFDQLISDLSNHNIIDYDQNKEYAATPLFSVVKHRLQMPEDNHSTDTHEGFEMLN
jgi:hypothetical protein